MRPLVPAVQRLGPTALLLQGRALVDLHYLAALGVRETVHRDGIRPPAPLLALLDELADCARAVQTAMSPNGHADVREATDLSTSTAADRIDAKEAADMLGISPRHARRLAVELMGRRGPGRTWTFDRGAVASALATRRVKDTA